VANAEDGTVSRIDTSAGKVVQTVRVGVGPSGLAYEDGAIWVTNAVAGTLSRLDAGTGRVTRTFPVASGVSQIAAGFGRLWLVSPSSGALFDLDPGSGTFDRVGVGVEPAAVTVGSDAVWVANRADGTISKVDPHAREVVDTVNVGTQPDAVVAGPAEIWVANAGADTLMKIDPSDDTVVRTVRLGNPPQALAADGNRLYAAIRSGGRSRRGGTLHVAAAGGIDFIDPALAYTPDTWSVLSLTNDGLVAFRRTGGVDGIQLVPDLATTLPVPEDAGTSYTFHLRPDVRYSNGRTVEPSDFRRALERLFEIRPNSRGAPYFADLVGADRCKPGRRCDLSRGVRTDPVARTVTFHLTKPDGDFLAKLALTFAVAVPAGTPRRDIGTKPLPATGPYEISSATTRTITLVRNPRFREWSADAKPDGDPDAIVVSEYPFGDPTLRSHAIEKSSRSIAVGLSPPMSKSQLGQLLTRYPARTELNSSPATAYFFLNTRTPPFDDANVRRAVRDAFDPTELATSLGAAFAASCDLLPPSLVSRRLPCRTGRPLDLKRAQAVVRKAGKSGASVTVWIPTPLIAQGHYMASVLDAIGLRAHLRIVPIPSYFPTVGDPHRRVQAGFGLWQSDFPTAGGFLAPLFRCSGSHPDTATNLSRTCNPHIEQQLRRAAALEAQDPPAANALWQQADAAILAYAPVVPMYNPQTVDFLGTLVSNYEYNPQWGVLLDQLSLR
jgi:peptide/nickel transport system substrate-binding protein